MNHDQLKNNITALIDGELPEGIRQKTEAHLAGCHECQAEVQLWKSISHHLFQAEEKFNSGLFTQKVMTKIENLNQSENNHRPLESITRWFFPAFASAALAGFVFVMTYTPMESPMIGTDDLLSTQPTETMTSDQILSYVMEDL
jgi:anti-sigma factor RsiW